MYLINLIIAITNKVYSYIALLLYNQYLAWLSYLAMIVIKLQLT